MSCNLCRWFRTLEDNNGTPETWCANEHFDLIKAHNEPMCIVDCNDFELAKGKSIVDIHWEFMRLYSKENNRLEIKKTLLIRYPNTGG